MSVDTTHSTQTQTGHEADIHHDGALELAPHAPTLYAEPLFSIGNFPVTNALFTTWIVVVMLVIVGIVVRLRLREVPGRLQTVFESIAEGGLSLCDQVTNDRSLSEKIFPIAGTLFVFVLAVNWMGIVPGVGSIGQVALHDGHAVLVPFLRGGTADINTTLALSLFTVLAANIFGIFAIGLWKMLNKFINLKALAEIPKKIKKDPTVVVVAPITFFVGIIEIVGEIAKVASLSFRLFGNVLLGKFCWHRWQPCSHMRCQSRFCSSRCSWALFRRLFLLC